MNTTEFMGGYGDALKSLRDRCIVLEGGKACRDGAKSEIKVTGYESMADFVNRNSAFLVKDLEEAISCLPEDCGHKDFSLRLCVENEATEGFGAWKGEAVYRDCLLIPFTDSRDHAFSDEFEAVDGFVVFDRACIIKDEHVVLVIDDDYGDEVEDEGKPEAETKCSCCKGCDCDKGCDRKDIVAVDRESVWKELANLLDTFRKGFGDAKGDGSFFKSFSYTDDGNGHVKAETDLNGEKKSYDFDYTI